MRSVARALPGGGGDALRAAASAACLAACLDAQGAEPLGPPRLVSAAGDPRVELTDGTAPLGFASRTPGLDSFLMEVAVPRAVGAERTIFPAFIVDFAIVRSHAQTQGRLPRRFDLASVIHLKATTGQIRIPREPETLNGREVLAVRDGQLPEFFRGSPGNCLRGSLLPCKAHSWGHD